MAQEKEPKGITRRQFLKGATALGASALFSSCGLEASSSPSGKEATPSSPELLPTGTPMATSTPFPESTRTETPSFLEPTPPREMITFPQVQITPDLLKQGFVGIGGEEEINLGVMGVLNQGESREKVSWQTIEGYTSLAWNEKMALADLAQDEVGAAKALISLGAQAGVEGFYQPKEVLPQFKDLTLLRLTINQLPDNQDFYDAKVNVSPQNLIIRKGTHLTLLGLWADESGRWATVAFDEGFDREKEGLQPREVPRQFLAVIPQNLPDETKGLSLESLLVANGYVYQVDMVEHQAESGQLYRQQLNTIEPTLAKKLEKEAGALFMDQKEDGSWYENPLVPYPPEEQTSSHTVQSGETLSQIAQTYGLTLDELLKLNPDIKDPSKITVGQELTILIPGFTGYHGPVLTEDGRVVILSADQTKELAQAKYDEEAKTWEWEKLAATAPAATAETTLEDASSLLLELDSEIISSLTELSQEIYGIKYLKSYKNRADELITGMGISDPYLVELYREFFNTEWVHPSWPGTEYHGLGIYTLTEQGKKPYLHSAVGLLYGFVPIENIPRQVIEMEKNASNTLPRPYYLILQIEPGKDLTPENNPDAFVALKMGAHIYGGEYDASGFALKKAEDSKLESFVVERITSQEPRKTNRGPDAWTLEELSSVFGLRKNSLIFVTGMAQTPGEASVSWFSIIVPEFPSEEVQKQYHFFLTD